MMKDYDLSQARATEYVREYRDYRNRLITRHNTQVVAHGDRNRFSHTSYYGPRDRKVVHPFTYSYTKWLYPVGSVERRELRDYRRIWGILCLSELPEGPYHSEANVYNQCLSKLNEKLRGSELQLSIALAEYKSTARMIAGCISAMRNVRREFKRALKTGKLKYANGKYLEATYGWGPLLSDFYSALDADWHAQPEFRVRVAKSDRYSIRDSTPGDSTDAVNGYLLKFTRRRDFKSEYRVNMGCTVGVQNEMQRKLGLLDSYNPLQIAWELIPYSFVLDWFYDIGSLIENYDAARGYPYLRLTNGYITRTSYQQMSEDLINFQDGFTGGATGAYRSCTVNRALWSGNPPQPKLPELDLSLSLRQMWNGLALTAQRLLPGGDPRRKAPRFRPRGDPKVWPPGLHL
jgi:hypothetical protein